MVKYHEPRGGFKPAKRSELAMLSVQEAGTPYGTFFNKKQNVWRVLNITPSEHCDIRHHLRRFCRGIAKLNHAPLEPWPKNKKDPQGGNRVKGIYPTWVQMGWKWIESRSEDLLREIELSPELSQYFDPNSVEAHGIYYIEDRFGAHIFHVAMLEYLADMSSRS